MDLLEEMLRCRDEYERYDVPSLVRQHLNENIDAVITEGMKDRK